MVFIDLIVQSIKYTIMLQNKKSGAPLILAGLAAFAYYKYSKLTPEQKRNIGDTIKEKGRDFYDKFLPKSVKNMFEKNEDNAEYADI